MAIEIDPSGGSSSGSSYKAQPRIQAAYSPGEKPHNIDLEKACLAGVIRSGDNFIEVQDEISASDFFYPAHQFIFETIVQLNFQSTPVDLNTIVDYLKNNAKLKRVGGPEYVADVAATPSSSLHTIEYAKKLKDLSWRRTMIENLERCSSLALATGATNEIAAEIEKNIFGATQEKKQKRMARLGQLLDGAITEYEKRSESGGKDENAVMTGLKDLDDTLSGLRPGQLVVLAARPGMGKTSLAANIMYDIACHQNKPVLFFSLEMTQEELVDRIISFAANIDQSKLRSGRLTQEDFQELFYAADDCKEAPLYIDDRSVCSPYDVLAQARRLISELSLQNPDTRLGLIVVDYIQIMKSGGRQESRTLEVAAITGGLKAIAKELKVPVLALSQLNREGAKRPGESKKPQLSDLRDSGAIEADADAVLFIHREQGEHTDSRAPSEAEIIVAKQRSGPTRNVKVTWLGHLTRFTDYISQEHAPSNYPGGSANSNFKEP
ncbi:replicative DNA helicase [bacterium]|nr:replicative DNA helicase [bacterium]